MAQRLNSRLIHIVSPLAFGIKALGLLLLGSPLLSAKTCPYPAPLKAGIKASALGAQLCQDITHRLKDIAQEIKDEPYSFTKIPPRNMCSTETTRQWRRVMLKLANEIKNTEKDYWSKRRQIEKSREKENSQILHKISQTQEKIKALDPPQLPQQKRRLIESRLSALGQELLELNSQFQSQSVQWSAKEHQSWQNQVNTLTQEFSSLSSQLDRTMIQRFQFELDAYRPFQKIPHFAQKIRTLSSRMTSSLQQRDPTEKKRRQQIKALKSQLKALKNKLHPRNPKQQQIRSQLSELHRKKEEKIKGTAKNNPDSQRIGGLRADIQRIDDNMWSTCRQSIPHFVLDKKDPLLTALDPIPGQLEVGWKIQNWGMTNCQADCTKTKGQCELTLEVNQLAADGDVTFESVDGPSRSLRRRKKDLYDTGKTSFRFPLHLNTVKPLKIQLQLEISPQGEIELSHQNKAPNLVLSSPPGAYRIRLNPPKPHHKISKKPKPGEIAQQLGVTSQNINPGMADISTLLVAEFGRMGEQFDDTMRRKIVPEFIAPKVALEVENSIQRLFQGGFEFTLPRSHDQYFGDQQLAQTQKLHQALNQIQVLTPPSRGFQRISTLPPTATSFRLSQRQIIHRWVRDSHFWGLFQPSSNPLAVAALYDLETKSQQILTEIKKEMVKKDTSKARQVDLALLYGEVGHLTQALKDARLRVTQNHYIDKATAGHLDVKPKRIHYNPHKDEFTLSAEACSPTFTSKENPLGPREESCFENTDFFVQVSLNDLNGILRQIHKEDRLFRLCLSPSSNNQCRHQVQTEEPPVLSVEGNQLYLKSILRSKVPFSRPKTQLRLQVPQLYLDDHYLKGKDLTVQATWRSLFEPTSTDAIALGSVALPILGIAPVVIRSLEYAVHEKVLEGKSDLMANQVNTSLANQPFTLREIRPSQDGQSIFVWGQLKEGSKPAPHLRHQFGSRQLASQCQESYQRATQRIQKIQAKSRSLTQ